MVNWSKKMAQILHLFLHACLPLGFWSSPSPLNLGYPCGLLQPRECRDRKVCQCQPYASTGLECFPLLSWTLPHLANSLGLVLWSTRCQQSKSKATPDTQPPDTLLAEYKYTREASLGQRSLTLMSNPTSPTRTLVCMSKTKCLLMQATDVGGCFYAALSWDYISDVAGTGISCLGWESNSLCLDAVV